MPNELTDSILLYTIDIEGTINGIEIHISAFCHHSKVLLINSSQASQFLSILALKLNYYEKYQNILFDPLPGFPSIISKYYSSEFQP